MVTPEARPGPGTYVLNSLRARVLAGVRVRLSLFGDTSATPVRPSASQWRPARSRAVWRLEGAMVALVAPGTF